MRKFLVFFALLCFLTTKAFASLPDFTHNTPSALEPAVASQSYQVAGIYWLPDYLGKNMDTNGRVNDRDNGGDKVKSCSDYGFEACEAPRSLKPGALPVKVIQGLNCYRNEDCQCPDEFKYTEINCYKIINGSKSSAAGSDICAGKANSCLTEASFPYFLLNNGSTCSTSTSCSGCPANTKPVDDTSNKWVNTIEKSSKVKSCACDTSAFPRTERLDKADCSLCTDTSGEQHFRCLCSSGYVCSGKTDSNGNCNSSCIEDCDDSYNISGGCPEGGVCSTCGGKSKLESCDSGYSLDTAHKTCQANACPANYSTTVTQCSTSSTKPDLSCSGISGKDKCCLCKCNAVDTACTEANYPATDKTNMATYQTCTTGCGSEKVTRYKALTCSDGLALVNGTCSKMTCESWLRDNGYTPVANGKELAAVFDGTDTTPVKIAFTTDYFDEPSLNLVINRDASFKGIDDFFDPSGGACDYGWLNFNIGNLEGNGAIKFSNMDVYLQSFNKDLSTSEGTSIGGYWAGKPSKLKAEFSGGYFYANEAYVTLQEGTKNGLSLDVVNTTAYADKIILFADTEDQTINIDFDIFSQRLYSNFAIMNFSKGLTIDDLFSVVPSVKNVQPQINFNNSYYGIMELNFGYYPKYVNEISLIQLNNAILDMNPGAFNYQKAVITHPGQSTLTINARGNSSITFNNDTFISSTNSSIPVINLYDKSFLENYYTKSAKKIKIVLNGSTSYATVTSPACSEPLKFELRDSSYGGDFEIKEFTSCKMSNICLESNEVIYYDYPATCHNIKGSFVPCGYSGVDGDCYYDAEINYYDSNGTCYCNDYNTTSLYVWGDGYTCEDSLKMLNAQCRDACLEVDCGLYDPSRNLW